MRPRAAHASQNANLQGVDFVGADLRDASFRNARLCSHNRVVSDNESYSDGRIQCADLLNANVRGADFRGVLVCRNGRDPADCKPVDAATLRRGSKSNLDGATLQ